VQLEAIIIENIASLKGKHQIDFNYLRDNSQIFAITGPTGSGKSTILSSISLALFGTSAKGNLNSSDYVTLGQSFGTIQLNFSIGEKVFVANWHCKTKKKNGESRAKPLTTRFLKELSSGKEYKIEDLLDLDINQFNKVAILHQGRFADFLHATFTERKKLLETLIGDKTLSTIGKNLTKILNDYNQEITLLSGIKDQVNILTQEEKKEYENQINELSHSIKKAEKKTNDLSQLVKNCEKNIEVSKKLPALIQRIKKEEKEYALIIDELSQAKDIEQKKTLNHDEYTRFFKSEEKKLKEAIVKKSNLDKEVTNTEKQTIVVENKKNSLTNWENEHNQEQKKLFLLHETFSKFKKRDQERSVESLESESQTLYEVKKIIDQEKIILETIKEIKNSITQLEKSIQQKKVEIKILKSELTSHQQEIIDQNTFFEYKEHFNSLVVVKEKTIAIKATLEHLLSQKNSTKEKVSNVSSLLASVAKKRDETNNQLAHYQKVLEQVKIHQSIEDIKQHIQRHKLEHCPICSSSMISESIDTSKKEHDVEEGLIKRLQNDLNEASLEFNKLQAQENSLESDYQEILKKEQSLKSELKKYQHQITDIQTVEKNILTIEKYLREEANEKRNISSLNEQLATTKKREKKVTLNLSQFIEKKESIPLESAKNEKTLLERRDEISKIITLKKEILSIKERQAGHQLKIDDIKKSLDQEEEKQNEIIKIIKRKRDEYHRQKLPKNPSQEYDSIKEKLSAHQEYLRQSKNQRREIDFKEQKKQSLLRSLNEQKEDINRMKLLYLSELEEISLGLKQNDDINLLKVKKLYQQDHINDFELTAYETYYSDHICPLEKQARTKLENIRREYTKIVTKLDEQKKLEQKNEVVIQKIRKLKKERSEYLDLEHYVGKDKFRDYALTVVEKNLVMLANEEIKSFAEGRYKLLHTKVGRASEFSIIDKWQGHTTRKISTLSGGETFMLSLALALALSRVNRGSQEIGFFLIDEGFGSLDSDSIDEVMDCLMGLHSRGKQIGLISHIKDLTTRIPCRIEVHKNQWGESKLSITS